jgi:pimeloyl-ACP methyl ester carboxylesterase
MENKGVQFISPLLEYGYPVTVEEYENNSLFEKPLLLYLPGFDGTFLCPFLQFPELGTIFDVRCMTVSTSDRSSFAQLTECVLQYIQQETMTMRRPIYLMGESFGGLLACNVALQIASDSHQLSDLLKGLALINPATSYDRSRLAREGPPVAQLPWWNYPAGLLQLLPLFTDEHSFQQLLLILTAQALPSVIDNPMREAYMGRVAFSLPLVIPTVTPSTLDWRLHAWLQTGCQYMTTRLHTLFDVHPNLRTLIVVGERDETLPSSEEAIRLQEILPNPCVRVIPDAGHASTCGSRADLAAYMRSHFPELNQGGGRTEMKEDAAQGEGAWYGMQERFDSARIGLNPLLYWSSPLYYRKYRP